ncbi:MAG: anthranilate synthase component II [Lacibacter sp.]
MKLLVFDNYDSFTYNLVHLVEKILGHSVDVVRNDQLSLEDVAVYDKIILSPGPGIPEEAGLLLPLIQRYAPEKSILGVCLGHQAIAEAFGGSLMNLQTVFHGVATPVHVLPEAVATTAKAENLFAGLPETFEAGRYHSWVVNQDRLPDCITVTAVDDSGMIMALRHNQYDVQGVQFHPESVLTPCGETILRNWLQRP